MGKAEIIKAIKLKKNSGIPLEDCYVEGYAYVLSLSSGDFFNTNLGGTRKFLPMHVAIYCNFGRHADVISVKEIKNGKILKKEIPEFTQYKPNLKIFETKEECLEEYQKDMQKTINEIDTYCNALFELKDSLIKALDI